MASNVVVLHNNRRHVIKTTPSMLCRDILTQACQKIGYQNTHQYGLKNGKNTVDLALPVRLSNLPAGAKLEIYKITASEASKPITLALQCADPPLRLTGTFPPTATLMEVLLHFEQESNGTLNIFGRKNEEAVLSVLGREFGITEGSGGGGQTTLAGMGVGGNVLVRLGFRKVGGASPASAGPMMSIQSGPSTSSQSGQSTSTKSESGRRINTIESISSGGSSGQRDTSYPRPLMPSPASSRSASPEPGSQRMDIHQQGHILSPSPSNPAPSPEYGSLPTDIPQRGHVLGSGSSNTAQFPPTSVPAQPSNISHEPSSSTQSESPELVPTPSEPASQEPFGPQNRKRIVFTAASASTPAAAKLNLDDSLYNMTTEQAKTYQAHLTATSKSLTDRTLMTKEMRDSLALERAQKRNFNHCDIRIRFPDGMQVQGTFGAQESVGDVYDFVRGLMRQDGLGFNLNLLPKGELSDLSLPIRQAGFAPRTIVVFRWDHGTQGILKDEVLHEAIDIEGVVKEMLEQADASRSTSSSGSGRDKGKGKAVENREGGSSGSGGGNKLPKWLNKLAKK